MLAYQKFRNIKMELCKRQGFRDFREEYCLVDIVLLGTVSSKATTLLVLSFSSNICLSIEYNMLNNR